MQLLYFTSSCFDGRCTDGVDTRIYSERFLSQLLYFLTGGLYKHRYIPCKYTRTACGLRVEFATLMKI